MGAVGCRECVVAIDVTEGCKPTGKALIIAFFPGVKTQIFQQHHVAVLHRLHRSAVSAINKGYRLVQCFLKGGHHM